MAISAGVSIATAIAAALAHSRRVMMEIPD